MTLRDASIKSSECLGPAYKDCASVQVHKRKGGPDCVRETGIRCIVVGMCLALAQFWAGPAYSQDLTASQALESLRENFRHKDDQPSLAFKPASVANRSSKSGPILSLSIEGAGRTDLYGIEQEISLFGQNKVYRRVEESAIAAEIADARHRERQTEARMLTVFYRLLHAQERKKAIGQGIVELEELVHSLQRFHASGRRPKPDLVPAQHALAEFRIAEAEAEIAIMENRSLVSSLLGEHIDPDHLHASGTLDPRYALPSLQESLVEALATRKDFQAAAARLEQAEIETSAASHWRLPNPRILGGLKRADLGDRYAVGPYFAVSMPIPMSGRRKKLKLAASKEESLMRRRLNLLRREILAEVRAAHHALRIRRKTVEDYRSTFPGRSADEHENILYSYRTGETKLVNLLGSIRMRQEATLRLIDLQAASKIAEVEFDRSSGKKAH